MSHNEQDRKRRIHDNLRDLIKKYKKMALQVGTLSLADNLLSRTNLSYNKEIMMVTLPLKLKVPQMDLYYGSNDSMEHLETFNAHLTLHWFSRVACYATL